MFTQVHLPHPALRPFVKFYLVQQFNATPGISTVLSCKGLAAIQFSFKTPAVTSFYYHGTAPEDKVHLGETPAIIGPPTTFGHAYFVGEQNLLAVALQPTATHHFIRESATAMTNRGINVELVEKEFNEVQEKLLGVAQSEVAIQLLEPHLIRFFHQNASYAWKKDLSVITNYIDQQMGLIGVEDLANHFHLSRRWLEKQFKTQIGMSPKGYARAIRFRNVLKHLYHMPQPSWMEVVAQFNYTDQSHLIKDFYQYTGSSPKEHFQSLHVVEQNIHQNF
ncbi:MAG: helix-turn-helix domain-containing protein [Haliscomenobacter sp.]|uniref:helix-turn-helix domain-containing protein n=1 Tax=Haliscomenobacter sp. TaxID=2717303 RepID=UPI0029BA4E04|nr:helix-turn-helix domain-containing protein [Haliscomenobacter sp.]MDX2070118.1 helix-turn-helix domain-containing protein [Haliscomenobacter sp.]